MKAALESLTIFALLLAEWLKLCATAGPGTGRKRPKLAPRSAPPLDRSAKLCSSKVTNAKRCKTSEAVNVLEGISWCMLSYDGLLSQYTSFH
jgi:hypothetical protein